MNYFKGYNPFQFSENRYQKENEFGVINQKKLAFWLGAAAILLPFIMLLAVATGECHFYSISHFYYSKNFGVFFVGILFFIGGILCVYEGENRYERDFATVAGVSAFLIAIIPTSGNGCHSPNFQARIFLENYSFNPGNLLGSVELEGFKESFFRSDYSWVHFSAAAVMFVFLAFMCLFVFTRIDPDLHLVKNDAGESYLTSEKKIRNRFYITCGLIIVFCIAILSVYSAVTYLSDGEKWQWWNQLNLTFVFESIALIMFGLSWLVKGRFLVGWLDDQ